MSDRKVHLFVLLTPGLSMLLTGSYCHWRAFDSQLGQGVIVPGNHGRLAPGFHYAVISDRNFTDFFGLP